MGKYLAVLFVFTLAACGSPALCQFSLKQYAITIKQVMQADKEMEAQMDLTAKKLEQFYAVNGHLPQTRFERQFFHDVLCKYVLANPYGPQERHIAGFTEVRAADTPSPTDKPAPYVVPLFWLRDSSLTPDKFAQLLQHPDPSWLADPGTMVILTDGSNTYLVWASSADRLPIRDFLCKDQPSVMICRRIAGVKDKRTIWQALVPQGQTH